MKLLQMECNSNWSSPPNNRQHYGFNIWFGLAEDDDGLGAEVEYVRICMFL